MATTTKPIAEPTRDEMYKSSLNVHTVAIAALLLGVLGGAFYWWVPMGIVLSLIGLTFGFVGWMNSRRKGADSRLLVAGMLVCIATLVVDFVIAALDLEIITLHSFQ